MQLVLRFWQPVKIRWRKLLFKPFDFTDVNKAMLLKEEANTVRLRNMPNL